MTPYEAYVLYLALKRHFTDKKYDFLQYNGKIRASRESFESRNDKYSFSKLAKMSDPKGFLLSNFIRHGTNVWIGTLLDDDLYDRTHKHWIRYNQALQYNFTNELEYLDDDLDEILKAPGGYPILLYKYLDSDISIETMVVLNSILNFIPYWDKKIDDKVVWPEYSLIIKKYSPFVRFDRDKMKNIMKERWIHHEDQSN